MTAVTAGNDSSDLLGALPDTALGTCAPSCPFLAQWDHPYWHHTAWCWKQMRDLNWYDYWIADCLSAEPSDMAQHRDGGRTQAPNAELSGGTQEQLK